jgi:hypothetical protein
MEAMRRTVDAGRYRFRFHRRGDIASTRRMALSSVRRSYLIHDGSRPFDWATNAVLTRSYRS